MQPSHVRFAHRWTRFLVPFALASVAAAQTMGGAMVARSRCVDVFTTTLQGTLFDAQGAPKFVFDAQLSGLRVGALTGELYRVPNDKTSEPLADVDYQLCGSFNRVPDGRLFVNGFISYDTGAWGRPMCIIVGDFQGFVQPNSEHLEQEPTSKLPSGYCPGPLPAPTDLADFNFARPPLNLDSSAQEPPRLVYDGCGHLHGRWHIG